jgi:hypothetical protein
MITKAAVHVSGIGTTSNRRRVIMSSGNSDKMKVVVTGAGGRTGQLVMKKLLSKGDVQAVGVVRSEASASKLKEYGASDDQIVIGDILADNGKEMLSSAMEGSHRLVICTSAVPKIKPFSLIPVILAKIFRKEGVRPKFTFKEGQMPEQIDWIGQKLQVDVAKEKGVEKVVVVGSMGGTQKDNFLNTIGDGNILVWKRRAEAYLVNSGLNYTIIHPGGLKDDEGGQREILLNVDDKFIKDGGKYRSIPRADVAELCVQALTLADMRAIDCVAKNSEDGNPTTDFKALFETVTMNCDYSDMESDPILGGSFASRA